MGTRRSWIALAAVALAGCASPPPAPIPYEPPAAGPEAQLTVTTGWMWMPNRVTLYLVPPGADPKSGKRQVVGQLQSGDGVRREILSFDARLAAGAPLLLMFEYRYDAGSVVESGCDFPVSVTLAAGSRYLVDFIKDTRSCDPRFYLVGKDGTRTELPLAKK